MPETKAPKRPPGRPVGHPKSGGRKPGVPNRKNAITRDYIIKNGCPLNILCQIAQGKKIQAADTESASKRVGIYPTVDQRLNAARILAAKVAPDLKSIDLAAGDGSPFVFQFIAGHTKC